ncbi:MAG: DUF3603 family protein [Bacilli bacterium]|jgi:hypothetical protein
MKYVYDILLNWTDNINAYEFYEWQTDDELEHIKKIPVIRINTDDFVAIHDNNIIIDDDLRQLLDQKTETFKGRLSNHIDMACIVTDGLRTIAIEFDRHGKSIFRSSLLLDESDEVLDIANKIEEMRIEYKVIKETKPLIFLTRYEQSIRKYLVNEFNKIYRTKNIDKLKYLYCEWYNEGSDDFEYMYKKMNEILDIEWNQKHHNLYNLIKLSYIKK